MAPPTRTPASTWIQAGLRALAEGGPSAVRVDALANSLGVTRGSFYGHFADRQALLEAMLDTWERIATDEVLGQVEQRGGDPRARLRRAGALTFSPDLLPTELAIRDWARRDPAVAVRLGRVDDYRMDYLRTLFRVIYDDEDTVEARSVLAFTLAIGRHFLAAGHAPHSRDHALELAVRELLGS
jgi:AcrR family transcriptional regulator